MKKKRIFNSGAFIEFGRVNGTLAVSRAFGDINYKDNTKLKPEEQAVSAEPEINRIKININQQQQQQLLNIDNLSFVVIACDGIWDVMKSEEAVEYVKNKIKDQQQKFIQNHNQQNGNQNNDNLEFNINNIDVVQICQELIDHCVLDLESKDNVSALIVLLKT